MDAEIKKLLDVVKPCTGGKVERLRQFDQLQDRLAPRLPPEKRSTFSRLLAKKLRI